MANHPNAGELENLKQFAKNLKVSRSTIFRRLKEGDPDFPRPLQRKPGSKLQWLTEDRLEYIQLLRARAKATRHDAARAPAEPLEDRPAA